MENQLIETDSVKNALESAGWNLDQELNNMTVKTNQMELPRVRIEHKEDRKSTRLNSSHKH